MVLKSRHAMDSQGKITGMYPIASSNGYSRKQRDPHVDKFSPNTGNSQQPEPKPPPLDEVLLLQSQKKRELK